MRDFEGLVRRLVDAGVEFALVGGFAAVAHGASRPTRDIDICCPVTEQNLAALLLALRGLNPCFRSTPARPRLPGSVEELKGFKRLYLDTDLGELDVLDEIAGVGGFEAVRAHSVQLELWDRRVWVLDLDALIAAKRALGREKDREALRELELLRAKLEEP